MSTKYTTAKFLIFSAIRYSVYRGGEGRGGEGRGGEGRGEGKWYTSLRVASMNLFTKRLSFTISLRSQQFH